MTTDTAAQHRDVLTQTEAVDRAARITNARYEIALSLTRGAATYTGDVSVAFDVGGDADTFLDFKGKRIDSLWINDQAVEPDWTGYRLTLPGEMLTERTTVRVVYENEYDHTGDGLHQFIDPEDGEEYLYTHFEPYYAHRLFPCFDQPDIKATYLLSVTAPADWQVITNTVPAGEMPGDDGRVRRDFAESETFSTYLFALVAGAYQPYRGEHNGLPLGFYCRKSLVTYVEPDIPELFEITRQGLDFFSQFFDYPYAFSKYDQVFVPEFNAGAMENVGAVTHYERLIFRDPPTDNQRQERAEVILHEMAHMWFGNLVTMRWWNDLWLNESFATYMAYLAMVEGTRFTTAWKAFNSGMKNWAYRQDQLITTHPIAGEVPDTDATFLNFDGITYGKGASALQQLVAAIGMDGFREGMRRYFREYAFSNTTLPQFMGALEAGSGRELSTWSRLWLETPSLNTLAATWESDGARITELTLSQTASPEYPTLRPHRVDLALARESDGGIAIESLPAEIDGARAEVAAARGQHEPVLVFPNHNDLTFAKIALDDRSLAYIRAHMERVTDPLLRQLLWSSLWSMVRDQQLTSTDYLALVREKVVLEPDIELLDTTLGYAGAALGAYVPESLRERESHAMVQTARSVLERGQDGDARIIWTRALVNAAFAPDDLRSVARLADGEESLPDVTIDQEMRWTITVRCMARDLPGASERLAAERERDPSDRGQRAALRAEVSRPDAAVKSAAWDRFNGEGYGSLHLTGAAMGGFNWSFQRELLSPYIERFYDALPGIFESRTHEFAAVYTSALFPSYIVEPATLDRSRRFLDGLDGQQPVLERMLRELNDDLARAIACRVFASQ